jgi:hypothetical protein
MLIVNEYWNKNENLYYFMILLPLNKNPIKSNFFEMFVRNQLYARFIATFILSLAVLGAILFSLELY